MKKIIFLFIALLLFMAALTSCKNNGAKTAESDTDTQIETETDEKLAYKLIDKKYYAVYSVIDNEAEEIDVPKEFNKRPVKYISDYAFKFSYVKKVTLPNSITHIGNSAFFGSDNLREINFPEGLLEIGDFAFYATAIESVTIPKSVTHIGTGAFGGCIDLKEISVEQQNKNYKSDGGILFSKDGKELLCHPAAVEKTSYTVPDGVTAIGYGAFEGCKIGEITIPAGVKLIEKYAFLNCESLKKITMPYLIKEIKEGTFKGCVNLTEVVFSDSVMLIGREAFYGCEKLKSVELPQKTVRIEAFAFFGCDLESVQIPKYVNYIGEGAFAGNKSLSKFEVNGENPNFTSQDGVLYSKDTKTLYFYPTNKANRSYTLGSNTNVILSYAFYDCDNLIEIVIPENVEKIEGEAIAECDDVKIFVRATVKPAGWDDDWNASKNPVFWGSGFGFHTSYGLIFSINESGVPNKEYFAVIGVAPEYYDVRNVTVPQSLYGVPVKAIGASAFMECISLEEITLPESIERIGTNAFTNNKITEIFIPKNVSYIEDAAFYLCHKLKNIKVDEQNRNYKSVDGVLFSKDGKLLHSYPSEKEVALYTVPDGVEIIEKYAFNRCKYLEKVVLSESVTEIRENAFYGCEKLTEIVISASVKKIDKTAFREINNLWKINVADENTAYKSIDGVFFTKDGKTLLLYPSGKEDITYEVPSGVEIIDDFAFQSCSRLAEITLPESLKSIGKSAFYDCNNITEITIPSGVTSIGENAFAFCLILQEVNLSNGITDLPSEVFYSCRELSKINIPESVTHIGENAFFNCIKLKSLIIPKSVTSIDDGAFYGCSSLVLYCEAESVPDGWSLKWYEGADIEVVWGHTID